MSSANSESFTSSFPSKLTEFTFLKNLISGFFFKIRKSGITTHNPSWEWSVGPGPHDAMVQGSSSHQALTPLFSPQGWTQIATSLCFCCYFSKLRVKRKVKCFFYLCLWQKCGNRNKSERHVFLTPGPLPTVILSLLSQSISFLTWSASSVHLKFWGWRLQEYKLLPGPARITKPVPHIRTAAISQAESSILKNEFIYFNWRIITLQYCDGFCHPSTWICQRYTCVILPPSVQFSSVDESSPTLCDPMDCSTPGLPVHHQFLEFTQTHVHWVCDAIQPSHPLSSPSPPTFNLSQHQGLFQWVTSSHHVAKGLEFQLQHQSFQWIFRTGFL